MGKCGGSKRNSTSSLPSFFQAYLPHRHHPHQPHHQLPCQLTFEKQAINRFTGSTRKGTRKKRNTSGNNVEKLGGLPSLKELLKGRSLRGDSESVEDGGVLQRRRRGLAPSLRPEIQRREFMNRNGDLIDLLKTAESLEIAKIKVDQDFKMDSNPPEYDAAGDSWEQYFNDNNEYQVDEFINPCENYHCPRGKVCAVSKDNKPKCICQDPSTCLQPAAQAELQLLMNAYRVVIMDQVCLPQRVTIVRHHYGPTVQLIAFSFQVCGTDNRTYESSCHLFTAKCFSEGAQRRPGLHLDYLGACRYIAPCQDHELAQFSLHIKNWLKEVLVHLYEYDLKNPGFLTKKQRIIVKKIYDLQRQLKVGAYTSSWRRSTFETNYLMHVYPVHWQFGQLDQKPADGSVSSKLTKHLEIGSPHSYLSHSELAPLRTSLIPMDHCTSRFFRECDLNRDRRVSLKEWCSCFGTRNELLVLWRQSASNKEEEEEELRTTERVGGVGVLLFFVVVTFQL
ncbi:SPRC protein, partial [Polypterus senegalus]